MSPLAATAAVRGWASPVAIVRIAPIVSALAARHGSRNPKANPSATARREGRVAFMACRMFPAAAPPKRSTAEAASRLVETLLAPDAPDRVGGQLVGLAEEARCVARTRAVEQAIALPVVEVFGGFEDPDLEPGFRFEEEPPAPGGLPGDGVPRSPAEVGAVVGPGGRRVQGDGPGDACARE